MATAPDKSSKADGAAAPAAAPATPVSTPPLPDSPLLTPPPRQLVQQRQVTAPVIGLPTPSREQAEARKLAVMARKTVNDTLTALANAVASLRAALAQVQEGSANAAEWTREDVDPAQIKQATDAFEVASKVFEAKA